MITPRVHGLLPIGSAVRLPPTAGRRLLGFLLAGAALLALAGTVALFIRTSSLGLCIVGLPVVVALAALSSAVQRGARVTTSFVDGARTRALHAWASTSSPAGSVAGALECPTCVAPLVAGDGAWFSHEEWTALSRDVRRRSPGGVSAVPSDVGGGVMLCAACSSELFGEIHPHGDFGAGSAALSRPAPTWEAPAWVRNAILSHSHDKSLGWRSGVREGFLAPGEWGEDLRNAGGLPLKAVEADWAAFCRAALHATGDGVRTVDGPIPGTAERLLSPSGVERALVTARLGGKYAYVSPVAPSSEVREADPTRPPAIGEPVPARPARPSPEGVFELLANHVARVARELPALGALLHPLIDMTNNQPLLQAIAGKLHLSLQDGGRHSIGLIVGRLFVNVTTLRGAVADVVAENERTGGYLPYVVNLATGAPGRAARAQGAEVLVHVVVHADPRSDIVSIHLGVFALTVPGFPPPPPIAALMPTDILTSRDRAQLASM